MISYICRKNGRWLHTSATDALGEPFFKCSAVVFWGVVCTALLESSWICSSEKYSGLLWETILNGHKNLCNINKELVKGEQALFKGILQIGSRVCNVVGCFSR